MLVGLSLLASLLVAVPGPTKAQAGPAPDYLASFEACPEDIIPDAGFSDVLARNDNAGDIDCIAYYGITHGTSLTTYAPKDPVIREHMALFLIRLAKLVGIRVPSPGSTTRFTDVAHLTTESQDAISQLALLRITIGTNRAGTTYTPDRNVSRGEMALFLQRLMDLMDPVADGRDVYGYIPDDVDRNAGDFDVESPFNDLDDVSVTVYDAVTQLYELGVASGDQGSVRFYRPSEDMSRAAMAEFMAAILDHSNLRPEGVMVQVSPTEGLGDFDITAMISVRDDRFGPREDQAVDWFYTDDSDDGGLESDGECNADVILGDGDCVWEDDNEDETDRDGNIFVERRATAGETMTFYAWIGRRDGDDFDEDSSNFAKAEAKSDKDATSLSVRHDAPANAATIGRDDGSIIVDLDRYSSIEFTVQLQDEDGNALEREDVEIEVEVESREIVVDAEADVGGVPMPDITYEGRRSSTDTTVLTDRRGQAAFDLDGPSNDERLDSVIFSAECCSDERVEIAWSDGESVLVAAIPNFDFYQSRSSGGKIEFTVEYNLYDQYGTALRNLGFRNTGREGEVKATPTFKLYEAVLAGDGGSYNVMPKQLGPSSKEMLKATISRGRIRSTLEVEDSDLDPNIDYFILVNPNIFSDLEETEEGALNPNEIRYASPEVIVWIVEDASDADDLVEREDFDPSVISDLMEVELYAADNKFRTFFTLWSYDSNDRFQIGGDSINVGEFEKLWEQVAGIEDITVIIYTSTRGFFVVNP